MKVLIVDTYYPQFLYDFYRKNSIAHRCYGDQRRALFDACFGVADYYSRHLNALEITSEEIIANCVPLETQWAREHDVCERSLLLRVPRRWAGTSIVGKLADKARGLLPIVAEQIRTARPDVLYMQDLSILPPSSLRSLKRHVGIVVGQTAAPLPPDEFLQPFDLILSSFPHYIPRLRAMGIASEYFRLGFEPLVLDRVGKPPRRFACTFVGGISAAHTRGTQFLEYLARNSDIDFFGYGATTLPPESAILRRHRGEVWALDMYRTLAESYITVNRHIDVAENNANNMRLYEATGMGAMLLTDAKANLGDLFEVGKEVVAYRDAAEAAELIRYYSAHSEERDAIGRAGQERTLRSHTYQQRMVELRDILTRHLRLRSVA